MREKASIAEYLGRKTNVAIVSNTLLHE